MPGQPDRAVALKRRETSELIAEELRRLDPDDTYASALRFGVDRLGGIQSAAERPERLLSRCRPAGARGDGRGARVGSGFDAVEHASLPASASAPAATGRRRPAPTPAKMPPVKKADPQ
jgi:hypothetical protein